MWKKYFFFVDFVLFIYLILVIKSMNKALEVGNLDHGNYFKIFLSKICQSTFEGEEQLRNTLKNILK